MTSAEYDDLLVATAMLLGGEPIYNDYDHPQYWSIRPAGGPTVFARTKAECASAFLRKKGFYIYRESGAIHSTAPTPRRYQDHEPRISTDL